MFWNTELTIISVDNKNVFCLADVPEDHGKEHCTLKRGYW